MSYIVLGLLLLLCCLQACLLTRGPDFMQPVVQTIEDVINLFPQTTQQIEQETKNVIEQASAHIKELVSIPKYDRTFTNTCYAYDRTSALIGQKMGVFRALASVSPDQNIRCACESAIERLDAFTICELAQNPAIYKSFKDYTASAMAQEHLEPEEKYYIKEMLSYFERSGLNLPEHEQEEVKELKKELCKLGNSFELAIDRDVRKITVPFDALAGLEQDFIQTLEKTPQGLYIVPVDPPTYTKVMDGAALSSTRKEMWISYNNRAYPQNEQTLHQIIALRDKLARKLGYASWADYEIEDEMAHTTYNVEHFLSDVATRSKPKAIKESERYTQELPEGVQLTEKGEFQPWDWAYVKNYYQKKHYAFDPEVVAQYFPLDSTVQALLSIYERFLDLKFTQLDVCMPWHKDVRVIQVERIDGVLIGYLLLDLFPRPSKYTHFCHMTIVPSLKYSKRGAHPGVSLVICNFPCPLGDKPALLRHDDVVTFFHEFGHALHALLGATYMAAFAGTNVKFDFVELPSQMFEEWMWDKDIIKQVSRHYKTGQQLPDALIKTMVTLKNFNSGDHITRQVSLAQLALDYFKAGERKDTHALLRTINQSLRPYIAWVPENHFDSSFGHLSGYSSRYYSYLWSKVFALDLFAYIKQHGLLNPEVGKRYVEAILSQGGSKPPELLLKDFLGREPQKEAFFQTLGL